MTNELQKLIGIDFPLCRKILIKAGIASLGKIIKDIVSQNYDC